MRFDKYLELDGAKSLRELADESEVSYVTVKSCARGMRIALYDTARKLSAVCTLKGSKESLVSVDDLCT